MIETFLDGRVRVIVGDITRERVDAVVNAANSSLMGGGGVDGAIHRVGGAKILEECREIRRNTYTKGLPTGEAVITTGGNLPARHVIHTVGPIFGMQEGREAELLAACYRNSLRLASEHGLSSVAFPSISTGAFSYPRSEAAVISSQAVENFLKSAEHSIEEVRFVFFKTSDAEMFLRHQRFSQSN
ncbi:MAG TPA: O-acetyl-ADP-ribose deacetylase [Pyrinomonadaceae bacterium]|nr:O-acetyl-ADP-ribose deacetylase [Pyrinomonadaceae bacterium]